MLPNLLVELSSPVGEEAPHIWILCADDTSIMTESGAIIVLEGPDDLLIEQYLRFKFKSNSNQDEYEALIIGMSLAIEMSASNLRARSKLQLIAN